VSLRRRRYKQSLNWNYFHGTQTYPPQPPSAFAFLSPSTTYTSSWSVIPASLFANSVVSDPSENERYGGLFYDDEATKMIRDIAILRTPSFWCSDYTVKGDNGSWMVQDSIDHPHTASPSPFPQKKPRIERVIVPTAPVSTSAAAARENGGEGGAVASDGPWQSEGAIAPVEAPLSSRTVTEGIAMPYCLSFVF